MSLQMRQSQFCLPIFRQQFMMGMASSVFPFTCLILTTRQLLWVSKRLQTYRMLFMEKVHLFPLNDQMRSVITTLRLFHFFMTWLSLQISPSIISSLVSCSVDIRSMGMRSSCSFSTITFENRRYIQSFTSFQMYTLNLSSTSQFQQVNSRLFWQPSNATFILVMLLRSKAQPFANCSCLFLVLQMVGVGSFPYCRVQRSSDSLSQLLLQEYSDFCWKAEKGLSILRRRERSPRLLSAVSLKWGVISLMGCSWSFCLGVSILPQVDVWDSRREDCSLVEGVTEMWRDFWRGWLLKTWKSSSSKVSCWSSSGRMEKYCEFQKDWNSLSISRNSDEINARKNHIFKEVEVANRDAVIKTSRKGAQSNCKNICYFPCYFIYVLPTNKTHLTLTAIIFLIIGIRSITES